MVQGFEQMSQLVIDSFLQPKSLNVLQKDV